MDTIKAQVDTWEAQRQALVNTTDTIHSTDSNVQMSVFPITPEEFYNFFVYLFKSTFTYIYNLDLSSMFLTSSQYPASHIPNADLVSPDVATFNMLAFSAISVCILHLFYLYLGNYIISYLLNNYNNVFIKKYAAKIRPVLDVRTKIIYLFTLIDFILIVALIILMILLNYY